MALNTLSFTTVVRQQVAAIQAACSTVLTFLVGSLELARVQAVAGVSMWLQSLVMQLLTTTRLSTSTGSDVDSFVGDFGLVREAAVAATGTVTFSRFTYTNSATIPVGTTVLTTDTTQTFTVIADATQALYNAALNAYVIPATQQSGNVTVQALNAGTQGNVGAGTITLISAAIVGVDTVTNAAAFANGVNEESDAALQARFLVYISGLKEGTKAAVTSAIDNLQQGFQFDIVENYAYGGSAQPGYFYVVITPSTSSDIAAVYAAVNAIRPLGVNFGVFAASTLNANIGMTAVAAAGYTHAQIAAAIATAIQSFIAGLGLGQPLYWSQLYAIAYGVPGVSEVTGMLLNSGTSDLVATAQQIVGAGTITVN
ncbi:MAG: baseplate J/gp47 family protein [Burkholderiaceae bacterium]|nr:baseplate J/gp47 family protein [Burkholderiaceae bacterium]